MAGSKTDVRKVFVLGHPVEESASSGPMNGGKGREPAKGAPPQDIVYDFFFYPYGKRGTTNSSRGSERRRQRRMGMGEYRWLGDSAWQLRGDRVFIRRKGKRGRNN